MHYNSKQFVIEILCATPELIDFDYEDLTLNQLYELYLLLNKITTKVKNLLRDERIKLRR